MWQEWIRFTAYGCPAGKPRPRATKINNFVRVYQPKTPKDWSAAIRAGAREVQPEHPILAPVKVDATFYLPRPKGHYGTGRNAGKLKKSAPYWHTKKPDRDNLDKAVLDVLTSLGYWRDDCQVCMGTLEKVYHEAGGTARAEVGIEYWVEGDEPPLFDEMPKGEGANAPVDVEPADDGFESFWREYPEHRRGSKADAQEAWDLHRHARKPQLAMKWLLHWKGRADWQADDGKWVPSAKNFLARYVMPQDPPKTVEKKTTPQSRTVRELAEAAIKRRREAERE